jgi:dsRNA-specific ribonuclease
MTTSAPTEIYIGIRGDKFKYFIKQVLSLANINEHFFNVLIDEEGLKMYDRVFTHSSVDSCNNYEYLEFLGDTTLNKSIAWYLSRRFDRFACSDGVQALTRLKINLISKRSFAGFAKRLSFWEFVSASTETRSNQMDKTLEDVFEAFFGATEVLIDSRIRQGAGYSVCYAIISNILDTMDISLRYEDLFDSKTRLKEVFDFFGASKIGVLVYDTEKVDRIHKVKAIRRFQGVDTVLGEGSSSLKVDAQQKAANLSFAKLDRMGFTKPDTKIMTMLKEYNKTI